MTMTFEQFKKRIESEYGLFWYHMKKTAIASSFRMEARAKLNATTFPQVRTGRLRSSIFGRVGIQNESLVITLQAGGGGAGQAVNYAEFVELGTRDPVKPRLFFSPDIGWRYASKGIKPRYFMKRAVDAEKPILEEKLGQALKRTLEGKK